MYRSKGAVRPVLPDEWLVRTCGAVLHSQDTSAAARRERLRLQIAAARGELDAFRREMREAKAALPRAEEQGKSADGRRADGGRGEGARGQRGRGRGGRGGRGVEAAGLRGGEDAEAAAAQPERRRGAAGGSKNERQPEAAAATSSGAGSDAEDTATSSAVARIALLIERAKAAVRVATQELAELGPAPPATQQAVDSGLLVAMLAELGRCVRERAGPELGRRAEAVVAQRQRDLQPQELVAALGAMAALGHTPVRSLTSSCLSALVPHLPRLNTADASSLLASLKAFAYVPSRASGGGASAGARMGAGEPSGAAVIGGIIAAASNGGGGGSRSGGGSAGGAGGKGAFDGLTGPDGAGLGEAPTGLILQLLGTCDAWSVPFPAELLPRLEQVVEQRVLRAVPQSAMMLLSARYQAIAATESRGRRGPLSAVLPGADADAEAMRSSLLEGVILPLARLRQSFAAGDMLTVALTDWQERGFAGMDEWSAGALLGAFAYSPSNWVLVPALRKALVALLERSLSLPITTPFGLAHVLLTACRAMRLMARKMQRPAGADITEFIAPSVAPLLLPAVERLLQLQPSAGHLASAAQGLFVELEWRGSGGEASAAAGAAAAAGGAAAAGPPGGMAQDLLARMLEAAGPGLEECRSKHYGWLLAACNAVAYRPPSAWLTQMYSAAAAALDRRDSTAEILIDVINGLSQLATAAVAAAAAAAGGDSGNGGAKAAAGKAAAALRRSLTDPQYVAAKEGLLLAVARGMLRETALKALSSQPEAFVTAGRQLAVLGLRPPADWLDAYTAAVQGLVPELKAAGLAYAAEGLALMRAAPPASLLVSLLVSADRTGLARFDPFLLGLLLGGVHSLRQNTLRAAREEARAAAASGGEEGQGPAPLSQAALTAWGRAHALFVTEARKANPLPKYTPAQLVLVVGAVATYELTRPYSAVRGGGGGGGGNVADLIGRVEEAWLEECCASLLQSRLTAARTSGSVALPPAALLVDLLRLTSRVVRRQPDGGIALLAADPGPEAGTSNASSSSFGAGNDASSAADTTTADRACALVLEYVRRSMTDLVKAGGRQGSAALGGSVAVTLDDWSDLLRAALAAGITPAPPELTAYSAGLTSSVTNRARKAVGAKHVADAASASASPLLRSAWADLSEGLNAVLLPALPWLPGAKQLQVLREGLLEQPPAVLAAASGGALAALCTWCSQVGPEVVPAEWWLRVRDEMVRRLPPLTATGTVRIASVGVQGPADLGGVELAAACYGLTVNGHEVPPELRDWLRRLLPAASVAAPAACAGGEEVGIHGGGSGLAAAEALRALQVLWAAHRCGCLELVPTGVWAAAYGGLGPRRTALSALAPPQLAQLVVLRAEGRRAGGAAGTAAGAERQLPQWFVSSWLGRLEEALKRQEQQQRSEAGLQLRQQGGGEGEGSPAGEQLLSPAVAAWAVAYCLPSNSRDVAPPALVEAALPAVAESLPAADVLAFLAAMQGRQGWALPQPTLERLVARMAGRPAAKSAAEGDEGDEAGMLAELPPHAAVQLLRAVLSTMPSEPSALEACLPALSAILPYAEYELYGMALPERLHRTVLATGLDAGLAAVCLVDVPSGWDTVRQPSAAAADAVSVYVKQLLDELPAQQPDASVLAMTWDALAEVPAADLSGLAAAIIAVGGPRTLPRPAAAALLRLLSVPGVPEQLPLASLEAAVEHNLRDAAVPMSDATAAVLDTRLQLCYKYSLSSTLAHRRAAALRACGAAAVITQRALLQVGDRVEGLSRGEALALLVELQAAGVRERLAVAQRPGLQAPVRGKRGDGSPALPPASTSAASLLAGRALAKPDGPFARLLEQLLRRCVVIAFRDGMHVTEAAALLAAVAALRRRLEGAECNDLWEGAHLLAEVPASRAEQGRELAGLWTFLEAAHDLGGLHFSSAMHRLAMRRVADSLACARPAAGRADPWVVSAPPAVRHRRCEADEVACLQAFSVMHYSGPYLLMAAAARALDAASRQFTMPHASFMFNFLNEEKQQANPSEDFVLRRPLPPDSRLLDARQLGLLYGIQNLRGNTEDEMPMDAFKRAAFRPIHNEALCRLEIRQDLPPLEHLTAMLDALEPLVLPNPGGLLLLPDASKDSLGKVELFLSGPLQKAILQGGGEWPEGIAPWDDLPILFWPTEPTEEALLEALYARPLTPLTPPAAREPAREPARELEGVEGRRQPEGKGLPNGDIRGAVDDHLQWLRSIPVDEGAGVAFGEAEQLQAKLRALGGRVSPELGRCGLAMYLAVNPGGIDVALTNSLGRAAAGPTARDEGPAVARSGAGAGARAPELVESTAGAAADAAAGATAPRSPAEAAPAAEALPEGTAAAQVMQEVQALLPAWVLALPEALAYGMHAARAGVEAAAVVHWPARDMESVEPVGQLASLIYKMLTRQEEEPILDPEGSGKDGEGGESRRSGGDIGATAKAASPEADAAAAAPGAVAASSDASGPVVVEGGSGSGGEDDPVASRALSDLLGLSVRKRVEGEAEPPAPFGGRTGSGKGGKPKSGGGFGRRLGH
ncbi:hypothetical protein GPECTOR_278g733 [Gonium pectorale]|uniref:Uncharacterized protein n=1 Tax=Gonium pectorale TaxID=33097 RepID=A0A150FW08_GONPE|nr:hypothetical protein GPECTOR_278g733 [Gonium pectorale]|eukprot:KXZ41804.1 hypothetical protein GPECTOR_278g733 [Gonium pectorale]